MTDDGSGAGGKIERRNFKLNAAEGAIFVAASAFISGQTVLPALVTRLGGNNTAVGLLGVLAYFGLFIPQIFAARHVQTRPWKKPWALGFGLAHRSVLLLIALSIFVWGADRPSLALLLFMILYAMVAVLTGISTPGWFDMFAKLTPTNRRGRLAGIRSSMGGVGSFLAGLALTGILASFAFPGNYVLCFVIAYGLQMVSWLTQTRLVETAPSQVVPAQSLGSYLHDLRALLRANHEFRRFLVSSAMLIVASMPISFFTVYALKEFHAGEEVVGEFTLLMMAIQVVSALANGYIADRFGNKAALISAAAALLLASATALFAPSLAVYHLVYVFLGINLGTEVITRYNISIEYGSVEQRSSYIGLMNTVLAPVYAAGLIGGVISDLFGHRAVFGAGIAFSVIGLALLLFRVRDPRVS